MRVWLRTLIVCGGVASASLGRAAPGPAPARRAGDAQKPNIDQLYRSAQQLDEAGEAEKSLAKVEEGLALAPKHLKLLLLRADILQRQRDYAAALTAYEAYVAAGATGRNRAEAEQIISALRIVQSTVLDITVASAGKTTIYLDSRAQGVFCTAEPTCKARLFPGPHRVIAERPGFEPWAGPVTIKAQETTRLPITLIEKPSQLTVRVAQAGASITVDDAAYDAPLQVPAGTHRVVVSLANHADTRIDVDAHEGKPMDLDVTLTPLVPIRVEPAQAALSLDGNPVALQDGRIPLPAGKHALIAKAAGFKDQRIDIPAEHAPDQPITIALERIVVPPPEPSMFTTRRKIGLGAGGVSVAALGAGIFLGLQSRSLKDDAYALCASPSIPCAEAAAANRTFERGRSRALQANIAFGVGAGAAVAAAVLWLTGGPEAPIAQGVAVSPQLGETTGLDVAVRF